MPPERTGALECLVINDENSAAQRASLSGRTLAAGDPVPLIGGAPPAGALGTMPVVPCPGGRDDFGDFDGEGVAFVPGVEPGTGHWYVVGSHGCSRKQGKARLSSFLVARVPIGQGGTLGWTELTWRLSGALRGNPELARWFAQPLGEQTQGLNIEGLAAVGGDLLFGLRAPIAGHAFIARVPQAALFALGQAGSAQAEVFRVALEGGGIRDMAALPDGRLLVLSGPPQEQASVPYAIWLVEARRVEGALPARKLGTLRDIPVGNERAKAEAITVIGREGGETRLLVLFDGLENGGPREYRVRF